MKIFDDFISNYSYFKYKNNKESGLYLFITDKFNKKKAIAMIRISIYDNTDYGYLSDLNVITKFRKQYLATTILEMANKYISKHRCKSVLSVKKRSWMYDWYLRLGYKTTDEDDGVFVELEKEL